MNMTLTEARAITGGLGKPSKMPGRAYGLPALECQTGSKLRKVDGSVCASCYALKGRYVFGNVQNAEYKRLDSLSHPNWIDAMVLLIDHECAAMPFFRWHDSGDLQDLHHLLQIVDIATRLPHINFWLPTRESKIVKTYLRTFESFPKNLTVRVSAAMVDGAAPIGFKTTSTVHKASAPIGHICPAPKQGGKCGKCRACWTGSVQNVSYHIH